MQQSEYTYRDITVTFIETTGAIDEGVVGWKEESEEWGAVGETLEEVRAAFREAVDDLLDH